MDDSILTSIKKLLGITEEYTHFDADVIMHINSTFAILSQLGVGPEAGFSIADNGTTWGEFLGDEQTLLFVKSYMHARVKLMFDPPLSSAAIEALNRQISELEWRITVAVDSIRKNKEED